MSSSIEEAKTKRELYLEQIVKVMQLNQMVNIQMEGQWSGNMGQWYYDITYKLLYVNPILMMTLGYDIREIESCYPLEDFLAYVHSEDQAMLINQLDDHGHGLTPVVECTCRLLNKTDGIQHLYISGRSLTEDNHKTFIVGEVYDVTNQYLTRKERKKRVIPDVVKDTLDPLTKLLSKPYMDQQLQRAITLGRAGQENFCLLALDLDFFKNINIHFGRDNGDKVLANVAQILLKETRQTDYIGRVGGDQFQIVLSGVDFKTGQMISERIRKAIANHMFVSGIRITVSGGLVNFDKHSYENLLEEASRLLKKSKKNGHNKMSY